MGRSLGIAEITKNEDGFDYLTESVKIIYIGRDLWSDKTMEMLPTVPEEGYNIAYGKDLKLALKANNEYELSEQIKEKSYYLISASY